MRGLISFVVGLLFALGLGISGMTQTHIVKGFLDIFGNWNINLIGVMIGAIAVHTITYHLVKKKHSPLLDTQFYLPTINDIDKKLLIGAALFGMGWGWAGICPGPGVVCLVSGKKEIALFVFSMFVGMKVFKVWGPRS